MTTSQKLVRAAATLALVLVLGFAYTSWVSSDSDGIKEGQVYALAYTYKTTIKGSSVEGRVFDFADRNLPRTSILVPVQDGHGIFLTKENPSLPESTVRKMRVRVPMIKIEGVTYPGYEYVEWQYHLGTTATQSVVPTVIPRK
ncbi:MAG: hypothetical protein KBC81_02800 [Candidatus Pacebacteria bacterium]|nr:hypothetical protein [Candidatus Paceibacterota bacterium]